MTLVNIDVDVFARFDRYTGGLVLRGYDPVEHTGWSKKAVPPFYFCDNFRKFAPKKYVHGPSTANDRSPNVVLVDGTSDIGIRQICATLLGVRHVPERLCGGPCLQRGAITSVRPLPLLPVSSSLTTI